MKLVNFQVVPTGERNDTESNKDNKVSMLGVLNLGIYPVNGAMTSL